jgi:hypothetical protein
VAERAHRVLEIRDGLIVTDRLTANAPVVEAAR